MDRRKPSIGTAVPAAGAALGLVILCTAAFIFLSSAGFAYDFRAYEAAARRLVEGGPLYLPGTAAAYARGAYEGLYLYPPPLAIALVPMTLLGSNAAAVAWLLARIALLVVGCAVMPVSRTVRLAVFAVACVTFPVLFDLNIGNISVVVFSLAALAWRFGDHRAVAAVLHATLIALRYPFGLFLVLWLAQRAYRKVVLTIFAGVVMIGLTLPIVGIAGYVDYTTILRTLPDISTGEHNLSVRATALAGGLPDGLATVLQLGAYAAGLGAVVFAGLRRDPDVAFVATATASLIVSPAMHPHYLVILLLPAALLADRGRWWGIAIPLLGWLPGTALPVVCLIVLVLVLSTGTSRAREDTSLAWIPSRAAR